MQDESPIDPEDVHDHSVRKMKPVPKSPNADEVRKHVATHVPFRSWCPKCVAARGHQSGHSASQAPIDHTPMVSLDYCFLRRGDDDVNIPVLVAKVRQQNFLIAHVVDHKGKGELQLQMQVQQNGDNGGFIENLRQKLCVTFK